MEYTQQQLLDIYQLAYKHDVQNLVAQNKQRDQIDTILDVAEFAYLIATDPTSEHTQNMARDYVEFIHRIHDAMMEELFAGSWSDPCVCLHHAIAVRAQLMEERVEELEKGDANLAENVAIAPPCALGGPSAENDEFIAAAYRWAAWADRCKSPNY